MSIKLTARKMHTHFDDNGLHWTLLHLFSRGASSAQVYFETRSRILERNNRRPGTNSVAVNQQVWGDHDWTQGGEEWTISEPWRQSVIDQFMTPNAGTPGATVEIGPGGGRWTEALHDQAEQLYLVDITHTTLDLCRRKLGDPENVEYLVADGSSLGGIPDASIDFLWSFDVFVHIAPAEQEAYAAEFARVLKPGARAVIHHAGDGGMNGGWRSAMTSDLFRKFVEENGFNVIAQVESWGVAGQHLPPIKGDVVTVVEAPTRKFFAGAR